MHKADSSIPIHQSAKTRRSEIVINRLGLLNEYDFTEAHRHQYYEFFYFEKGGGSHKIDFIDFPIQSNSVHIVAPGQVHQMKRALDSEGYVFLFEPESLNAPKMIEGFLFEHACLDAEELNPCYTLNNSDSEENRARARRIFSYYQSGTELDKLSMCNEIHSLCIACMKLKGEVKPGNPDYLRFRSLLKDRYRDLKKVKDYAALMNLSEKTLNELVKKHTGTPASAVIYDHIIMEAKRYLHTNISIKETAYALNFDDPAHFSKFFKTQTGMNPSEFQNCT